MKKISLLLIMFISIIGVGNLWAYQSTMTYDQNGQPLFYLDIANSGDYYLEPDEYNSDGISSWTLNDEYIKAIVIGLQYWANLIGNSRSALGDVNPSTISVGAFSRENAYATSAWREHGSGKTTLANAVYGNFTDNYIPSEDYENPNYNMVVYSQIGMGQFSNAYFGEMSVLAKNTAGAQIAAVMAHEIGHAMGISSYVGLADDDKYKFGSYTGNIGGLTKYDSYLYDSFGEKISNELRQEVTLVELGVDVQVSTNFQIIKKDLDGDGNRFGYAYFWTDYSTSNVKAVLKYGEGTGILIYGDLNPNNQLGIPINGFEIVRNDNGSIRYDSNNNPMYIPDLSHIELRNSMMSHQQYRNWNTFMEAELALLQDIGIDVDRRSFYGKSIYADDKRIIVSISDLESFSTEVNPSTTALAIGLHIYGTSNTVEMQGNVFANGRGSAGIRVDGWNNNLTIDSNIMVNGDEGTGLMVAYGRNHVITHEGVIIATGTDGIGARFDFGGNILGDTREYRGSYIRTVGEMGYNNYKPHSKLPQELQGPLVSSFNVAGKIEGSKAAIYISQNAFVKEINVMNGAEIIGDIISDWNPNNPLIQSSKALITTMTFGKDTDGSPDGTFSFEYSGNIISPKSIDLLIYGGLFKYSGENMILSSFRVAPDAVVTFLPTSFDMEIDSSQIVVDEEAEVIIDLTGLTMGTDTFRYNEGGFFSIVKFKSSNIAFNGTSNFIGKSANELPELAIGMYIYPQGSYELFSGKGMPVVKLFNTNRILNTDKTGFNYNISATPLLITLQNPAGNFIFKRTQEVWNKNISRLHGNAFNIEREYNKSSLWVRPMYNTTKGKSDLDYDITGTGIALGADHWFSDVVFGGIGGSIDMPKYKTDVSDIQTNLMRGFVYGGIFLAGDIGINIFAAMGQASYDQNRKSNNETYTASYTGTQMEGGIEIERMFYIGKQSQITPFASFGYISLDTENYDEKGGKSNLHYDLDAATTQQISLGLKYKYDISSQFSIGSQAFYKILSGDKQGKAQFSLADDPYKFEKIPVTGQEADAGSIGFGLDFIYSVSQALNLNAGYTLQTGSNQTNHQIGMDLSVHF